MLKLNSDNVALLKETAAFLMTIGYLNSDLILLCPNLIG